MKFNSKNLLVTGGAGFIGSNFIDYFLNKYNDTNVINLDILTYAGNLDNLKNVKNNSRYKFIHGDICDKKLVENIFLEHKIDGVINFAAETHVDNSINNPNIFIRTNINGVFNLLNICYRHWMTSPFKVKSIFKYARFHQISTDEIYGSIIKGSFTEKSNYYPNSPYSASKASADMLVRSFNKTYGLNTTTSISSNNFGPNQNNEKFIPKIIESLINSKPIPVYGDGLNIRDWIYVEDHCKAIDIIFRNSTDGNVYNVGGKNELTNLELIDLISKIIKTKTKAKKIINFVKDRYGHDKRYSLNIGKIEKDFNWKPTNKIEDYLSNRIYG
jgi:dTDP-glucose 4,6-dehydratase